MKLVFPIVMSGSASCMQIKTVRALWRIWNTEIGIYFVSAFWYLFCIYSCLSPGSMLSLPKMSTTFTYIQTHSPAILAMLDLSVSLYRHIFRSRKSENSERRILFDTSYSKLRSTWKLSLVGSPEKLILSALRFLQKPVIIALPIEFLPYFVSKLELLILELCFLSDAYNIFWDYSRGHEREFELNKGPISWSLLRLT